MNQSLRAIVFSAAAVAVSGVAAAEPNLEKYNKSCVVCHDQGVAGAPKTGDAAAWAPRLEKGMDGLVTSIKNGLNAMPPMGMCMDCTDEEYMELIKYMAAAAK
ncbi:MAG: c-type cytochrome [Pseudomonadota bacterium]